MTRILTVILVLCPLSISAAEPSRQNSAFFENSVRPLLVRSCLKCHGPAKQESGLRLDSRAGLMKGGELGPAIRGKDPKSSRLIQAVRHDGDLKMPPTKKLSKRDIGILVKWVKLGTPWPKGTAIAEPGSQLRGGPITKADRRFWSFQPIKNPALPRVNNTVWLSNEIDTFILATLEQKRLPPVRRATRHELIRRATYDLTGLPPTPSELRTFLSDDAADAYPRLVDRLLASSAYGARWGRHWLDVVRYADTAGETADFPVPKAYIYRNWVVAALNADKPYDQFIREQLAGDLIAEKSNASPDRFRDLVTATGFVAISRRFGFNVEGYHNLTIQDTIDTIGQSILGLSLGCARCHDHKYDPVNKEDYYAWYGIFSSTRYSNPGCESSKVPKDFAPVIPLAQAVQRKKQYKERMALLQKEIKTLGISATRVESELKSLSPYLTGAGGQASWNPFASAIKAKLLVDSIVNSDGHKGLHVWRPRGQALPIVAVNSSTQTLKIPGVVKPNMVVLHPPQKEGVAIAWRSPITGRIKVTGRTADAHDCGDSVAWFVDRLHKGGFTSLAQGSLSKNRSQRFDHSKFPKLRELKVNKGDFLQFSILPQTNYGCDLTSVSLKVEELTGKRQVWDLSKDLSRNKSNRRRPNPYVDSYGNSSAWHFYSVPTHRGAASFVKIAKIRDIKQARKRARQLSSLLSVTRKKLADHKQEQAKLTRQGAIPVVYGVVEGKIADAPIQRRGNKLDLGRKVKRRNLQILGGESIAAPKKESGRLDLARWMTAKTNPLTARVMANRIWQHHFGTGLVGTENDFGARGERPSHPLLLDWLANYFIKHGWSIKKMHRKIMLSTSYQLSSEYSAKAAKLDPASRLIWRMNRRRLTAEEYRDSLLQLAGSLDRSTGGEHPFPPASRWTFSQHAPFYGLYPSDRRSIYLMQQRLKRHPFLALFDGADPNVSTARRSTTTTPTQALFLMNDNFVHRCSNDFAARIMAESSTTSERIRSAYRWSLAHQAESESVNDARKFLGIYETRLKRLGKSPKESSRLALAAFIRTLFVRNEFLFVD